MSGLVVTAAGASTTLQDGGRTGSARYGVPRSGPVDVLSHRLAARLAHVPSGEVARTVALEVGPQPCTIVAQGAPVLLAIAGAGAVAATEHTTIEAPCVVRLEPGRAWTVRVRTWGYAVPAGRIRVAPSLGSRSHHPRSGLGPVVTDGTELALGPQRRLRVGRYASPALPGGPLDILAAPQTDLFTPASLAVLTGGSLRTTTGFDRMGHRLAGPQLRVEGGHDIVSDGIVAGSIQVPGDGVPYVLTADHQTTGGYPKVAVLSTESLARFVRLPPDAPVQLAWVDLATARARLHDAVAEIEEIVDGRVKPTGQSLHGANLIDGVTDGAPPAT